MNDAVKWLQRAGLLPNDNVPAEGSPEEWKNALLGAWRAAASSTGQKKHGSAIIDRLQGGCDLYLGTPDWASKANDGWEEWIGTRFCWWPANVPRSHGTAIVSSRLGRRLDKHRGWLRVLDARAEQSNASTCLVHSPHTSTDELSRHLGRRHKMPLISVRCADNWQLWGNRCRKAGAWVEFSPPIGRQARRVSAFPIADRLVQAVTADVWVGQVRAEGNIDRLLTFREHCRPPSSIEHMPSLAEKRNDCIDDWLRQQQSCGTAPVLHIEQIACRSSWLQHWTRDCPGPWPGQSVDAFWDDLFELNARGDRSALATLVRIINTRQLVGGSRTVAGPTRAVSFTAVPLTRWPSRRFRSHRGRYDFERYGISVRGDVLLAKGALPVVYGTANTNAAGDYFQRIQAGDPHGWTMEREWRILGDVDLSGLYADEALVFVASHREAELVSRISPWPVTYFE